MSDMKIEILDQSTVQLVDLMGDDKSIVRAAKASVSEEILDLENATPKSISGLIHYLMEHRHGSPFEHTSMTLYIEAPIFVFREFQRHRIGFSYNEMSGRYMTLPPRFYVPNPLRPMVNVGTSARPEMDYGDPVMYKNFRDATIESYQQAWMTYQEHLRNGVANEIARSVLPVGIMSRMYVTMNVRSALNFLSLRTHVEDAARVSYPQYEIELVAWDIAEIIYKHFPYTHEAFNKFGRLAP